MKQQQRQRRRQCIPRSRAQEESRGEKEEVEEREKKREVVSSAATIVARAAAAAMGMARKCCVPGCEADVREARARGLPLHKFPKDAALRDRWLASGGFAAGFRPTPGQVVCHRHFRRADYEAARGPKLLLRRGSVPTVFADYDNHPGTFCPRRRERTSERTLETLTATGTPPPRRAKWRGRRRRVVERAKRSCLSRIVLPFARAPSSPPSPFLCFSFSLSLSPPLLSPLREIRIPPPARAGSIRRISAAEPRGASSCVRHARLAARTPPVCAPVVLLLRVRYYTHVLSSSCECDTFPLGFFFLFLLSSRPRDRRR